MQINFSKLFPLLLIYTFSLSVCSIFAEDMPVEVEQNKADSSEEILTESDTILTNIQQLIQKSAELKEVAAKVPDFDQLLFITLLIDIENDLYTEFDHLISIQQKLDKTTPEAQYLHIQ